MNSDKGQSVDLVEAIHEHKGTSAKRTLMTFLVEWQGYDELSWEPWENLKNNAILLTES